MQLQDNDEVSLSLTATDSRGNPVSGAALGSISWTVDAPNLISLTPSADSSTCVAAAVGPLGDATITVSATLPDGASSSGTLPVTVVAGDPTSITIVPGTPTPQPVSPPPTPPPAPQKKK